MSAQFLLSSGSLSISRSSSLSFLLNDFSSAVVFWCRQLSIIGLTYSTVPSRTLFEVVTSLCSMNDRFDVAANGAVASSFELSAQVIHSGDFEIPRASLTSEGPEES